MRVLVLLTAILAIWSGTAVCGLAQVEKVLPFKKKDTSRGDSQVLTQENGPWLIMCASFEGEKGRMQAEALVEELRNQHKLKAYVFEQRFDYSGDIAGIGFDSRPGERLSNGQQLARPAKMKAASPDVIEEVAVVVGDFASFDDSRAQKSSREDQNAPTACFGISTAYRDRTTVR